MSNRRGATKRTKLAQPEASVSRVSWLNLHLRIPQKDIRKLVYALLSPEDREMVACAHNTRRVPDLTEDFLYHSARHGYVELLDWACSNECQVSEAVFEVAAEEGRWKVLQWGLENDCVFEEAVCMSVALDGGHLDLLKWGLANGLPVHGDVCSIAAQYGYLEVLHRLGS
jgi:hypothetical protein